MTPSPPDYLAELYRLEELEGWRLLARHLELTDGFSFVVVLAPDDNAVGYLRSRLSEIVGPAPEAVRRVVFDPAADVGSLAESLLDLELSESTRLIWVDADPVDPDRIPARNGAWRAALARVNRYRNSLQSRFHCALVLAGPFSLQTILRETAPDLWSIRSTVIRIEPVGSARLPDEFTRQLPSERADFDGLGLSGDPTTTLAEAEKLRGKPGRELLLAQLLWRAGRQAYRLLNRELAIRCLQEAYVLEEAYGGDPELRLQIANELAQVFHQLARWDRAQHYAQKALEIAEISFGPSHQSTATTLNNLSLLLQATNRLGEAEPLMRRALTIDEANLGPGHPNVATDLNNLALLLKATNRLAEAEPLMRRALAIGEVSLGPGHPNVANCLNNLAMLLIETNRLAEAEPLMRRALAIDEASLGPDHPNVAIRLSNLTRLLQATNRLAEAEPLMRRALVINETSFGPNHPYVAICFNNLALLLQATNRLVEAEPLMRSALAIDEATLGPGHPNVATNLNNLARLLQATNRLVEAETLMRRALAIDEVSLGPDHPSVANRLNNLARLLQDTNRVAEAESPMRRALEILAESGRKTGHNHPHLETVIANYRGILKDLNLPQDEIANRIREALGI